MLADRIEAKWIDAFCEIFERCAVKPGDTAAILSETQSRALNVHIAELALLRMGAKPFHVIVPTPRNRQVVPIRSTGASEAIGGRIQVPVHLDSVVMRPVVASPPLTLLFHAGRLCLRASSSTTMKPTLCRFLAYFAPGLPSPTTSHMRRQN